MTHKRSFLGLVKRPPALALSSTYNTIYLCILEPNHFLSYQWCSLSLYWKKIYSRRQTGLLKSSRSLGYLHLQGPLVPLIRKLKKILYRMFGPGLSNDLSIIFFSIQIFYTICYNPFKRFHNNRIHFDTLVHHLAIKVDLDLKLSNDILIVRLILHSVCATI